MYTACVYACLTVKFTKNPESKSHLDCKSHPIFSDVRFHVKRCDLYSGKYSMSSSLLQVIIPGYCVQGTVGNKVLSGQKRIEIYGKMVCAIGYILCTLPGFI